MTEPQITVRHVGGNTVTGSPAAISQFYLKEGWTLETIEMPPLPPTETIRTVSPKIVRSPWTWPLVALAALLVVVLGGTFLALTLGGTS